MPAEKKKTTGKKPAPAPYSKDAPKAATKEPTGPIWEKKPKNFAIGGDIRAFRTCAPPFAATAFPSVHPIRSDARSTSLAHRQSPAGSLAAT